MIDLGADHIRLLDSPGARLENILTRGLRRKWGLGKRALPMLMTCLEADFKPMVGLYCS